MGHSLIDKLKLLGIGSWLLIRDKHKSNIIIDVQLRDNQHVFPFRIVDFGDFGTLNEVFCDGIYETGLKDPVHTIIDIGSNIGASAVFFTNRYPKATIYCFEPDSKAYNCLIANTISIDNVFTHNKAIWSSNTDRVFYSDPHRTNSSSLAHRHPRQIPKTVSTNTLDYVLSSLKLKSVDIIKFDVEGAEFDIFQSFAQYEKVRLIIGEVHTDLIGDLNRFTNILPEFFQVRTEEMGRDRVSLTAFNTYLE